MSTSGSDLRPDLHQLLTILETMLQEEQEVFFSEPEFELLADYFEDDDQPGRALELINAALRHYPYTLDLHLRKAELLLRASEAHKALEALDGAMHLNPFELDICLLRAESLAFLGEYEAALDVLEDRFAESETPDDRSDILYIQGLILEQMEEYEGMYQALRSALEWRPGHPEALERFGIAVEITRKYKESIVFHQALVDDHPYTALAWFNLGQALAYEAAYEDALEALEYAFLIDPAFEMAYREYIELCFELRDYANALRVIEEMQEHVPADSDLAMRAGQCHFYIGSYPAGQKALLHALRLDPLNDEALFFLGKCFAAEENWPKAIQYFSKAIRIDGEQETYFAAMADVQARIGNDKAAEHYIQQAISLAPEEVYYWITYASFLLAKGKARKAWAMLENSDAMGFGPELEYARVACLFALGRKQEALLVLEEALLEDFDSHPGLFRLLPGIETDPQVRSLIHIYSPI
ncbi:MAG: tetratricopeptide repeat protein [Haliscomenobacter sp.]|nr:tetratricopeptide repeat protein [Haliscomenobacter sp.]